MGRAYEIGYREGTAEAWDELLPIAERGLTDRENRRRAALVMNERRRALRIDWRPKARRLDKDLRDVSPHLTLRARARWIARRIGRAHRTVEDYLYTLR
jgi:hypothetical protein